jgi:hypothetical protein
MCFMTDSYYPECQHWGSARVESPCEAARIAKQRSGCCNKTTVGSTRITGRCPACHYRASLISSSSTAPGLRSKFPDSDSDSEADTPARASQPEQQDPPHHANTSHEEAARRFLFTRRLPSGVVEPFSRQSLRRGTPAGREGGRDHNAAYHLPIS